MTQTPTQTSAQTQTQSMIPETKREWTVLPDGTVVFNSNAAQEQGQQTQIIEVQQKPRKRPEKPEDLCAIVEGELYKAIEHGNAVYAVCTTRGRIVVWKAFKAKNYLYVKSYLGIELDIVEKLIETIKGAKEHYITNYELNRLIAWLKNNPELIRQIIKQLNIS